MDAEETIEEQLAKTRFCDDFRAHYELTEECCMTCHEEWKMDVGEPTNHFSPEGRFCICHALDDAFEAHFGLSVNHCDDGSCPPREVVLSLRRPPPKPRKPRRPRMSGAISIDLSPIVQNIKDEPLEVMDLKGPTTHMLWCKMAIQANLQSDPKNYEFEDKKRKFWTKFKAAEKSEEAKNVVSIKPENWKWVINRLQEISAPFQVREYILSQIDGEYTQAQMDDL